ncbi:hypothetical protein AAG570_012781, partial [Ranatra chinensis]
EDCNNYIRVGAQIEEDQVLICGTNAYKPLCRVYKFTDDSIDVISEIEGQGRCPYDPRHNSTSLYSDGQLYAATVADFSGVGPLIYREPLKTELVDLKQLNDPDFVSSISYMGYVLFFFREAAVEYMNCGKVVYSRVARVCKNDKGGPHQFGDRWTSFVKARLNCSMPGDYPFYFNEIQSTSDIIEGVYGSNKTQIIYGVFTTATNSIPGSAVCAFTLDSIIKTFDGPFKYQPSMDSNWLRVPQSEVPDPRPGKCVNDSRTLPDASVNFIKSRSLMDEAVPYFMPPLLVRISLRNRFTAIAVDPQIETLTGQKLDILFIGTDDGRVIKAVNRGTGKPAALFVEEIQIANTNFAINSLHITRLPNHPPKLIIVTNNVIQSVPLYRCSSISTCRECVAIQDPYCAWDSLSNTCVAHGDYGGNKKHFFQNIIRGSHSSCQPPGMALHTDQISVNVYSRSQYVEENGVQSCPKCSICNPTPCTNSNGGPEAKENFVVYTSETLGMVIGSSVIVSFVVGLLAGYFCSKYCRPENDYSNMPMHTQQLNSSINGEGSYPCANNKSINLVVNVPPKNANDKNANTSENNKTLQKVKKTYI